MRSEDDNRHTATNRNTLTRQVSDVADVAEGADDPATPMLAELYRLGGWPRVVREITAANFRQPDGKLYTTKTALAAFGTRVAKHLAERLATRQTS